MFAAPIRPVQALEEELAATVQELDLGAVPASDLPALVEASARIERLGHTLKALAAARLATTKAWEGQGDRSAAEWVARRTGTTASDATRAIRTGRRLEDLPATAAAARRGDLSATQSAAITDAASADPSAEERLLDLAGRASVGELRDACGKTKAAADPDPEARRDRIRRARCVRTWTDSDGTAHLKASGPPESIARVHASIQHRADRIFRERRREDRVESVDAYRFDALEELATSTGDGPALPRGADAKVIVRVDHAALCRGRVVGDEVCEIAGVGPIAVSVVREWMADAFVAALLTKGTDVRSVVHLGRRFTALQQTALQWQDPECAVLGCHRSSRLEMDHRDDWARTRQTTIASADRLCDPHHDLKTRQGWMLEAGSGKRRLLPPHDPDHPLAAAVEAATQAQRGRRLAAVGPAG